MNIWSKVLVGLIFVSAVAFFYFATRTLASHAAWQKAVATYPPVLEAQQKLIKKFEEGDNTTTPPTPSISELEVKLHDLLTGRGKVWRGCTKQKVDAATLQVAVEVPFPDPHQIQDKMVLYLFEEANGGHYLGEYKVVGIAGKSVSLAPTMMPPTPNLLKQQTDRMNGTRSTWSMYEKLPTDRHDVFRGYDQNQLSQLMPGVPADVLQEYLRDGTDAQPNDPADRVVDKKYERLLRDYGEYFHALNGQLASLRDQIAAATTDKRIAEKLQADTEKEVQARLTLIDKTLKPELEESKQEVAVITAHRDALQAKLDEVRKQMDATLADNRRLLAQWVAMQTSAAKRLDEIIDRETAGTAAPYTGE
ncbi:MAG TPA: hypothetical protein VNH11_29255 [Pirellulales bacterium]|nr:hypothetical protein [Pirellulales bacterium]